MRTGPRAKSKKPNRHGELAVIRHNGMRWCAALLIALALGGCAEQRILNEANHQMAADAHRDAYF